MEAFNLLPDPQTNGGILFTVKESAMEEVKALFVRYALEAHLQPIGKMIGRQDKTIIVKN
jgi:selenide,water dikinase